MNFVLTKNFTVKNLKQIIFAGLILFCLSSCGNSEFPKVSSQEFEQLEQELDEAISDSRISTEKGIEELEALSLLPKLLEDRKNYILGTLYLEQKNTPMAFVSFNKVSKNYLTKYSLWNLVQIAQSIGLERIVIENLNILTKQYPKEPKFLYELAKSYARQSDFKNAQKLFESVQKNFPKSEYSIGANYYLGNLAGDKEVKLQYYVDYLKASPKGNLAALASDQILRIYDAEKKLSNERAKALISGMQSTQAVASKEPSKDNILNPNNIKEIENLIAISYFSAEEYNKAIKYFGNGSQTWFERAKTLAKLKRADEAINLLMQKIPQESDEQVAKDALDYLISISDSWRKLARLRELEPRMRIIRDKVLWHIAERTNEKSDYRAVYEGFPDSFYAPESMARVFWSEYKHNYLENALELAKRHWQKYEHAKSHPFVAFWKGKIYLEQNKLDEAREAFSTLIEKHPRDYYRFRPEAILADGNSNNWFLMPKIKEFATLVNWDWPMPYSAGQIRRMYGPDVVELINIQQYAFILSLEQIEKISLDKKFQMWLYAMDRNHLKAISTAYFDIEKSSPLNGDDIKHQYSFPMLYSNLVADNASRFSRMDPMLAHALIKQESRYQPEIISRAGAIGLMQLMPYTAKAVASEIKMKSPSLDDLRNPEINITLGMQYLEDALAKFDNNLVFAIASYNAGPEAVKRWMKKYDTKDLDMFIEEIPYFETRDYTKHVLENYWIYKKLYS